MTHLLFPVKGRAQKESLIFTLDTLTYKLDLTSLCLV